MSMECKCKTIGNDFSGNALYVNSSSCPVHKPETNGSEEWKRPSWSEGLEEFGSIHDANCDVNKEDGALIGCDCKTMDSLKSFIRDLLAKERERILQECRLEKDPEYSQWEDEHQWGYDRAMRQLEKKLKEIEHE